MITKNPMQLKAIIKNKAKKSNITPLVKGITYEQTLKAVEDCLINLMQN